MDKKLVCQKEREKWYCFMRTLNASTTGVGGSIQESIDDYNKKMKSNCPFGETFHARKSSEAEIIQ